MGQGGCRKNPDEKLKASGHAFTVGRLTEVVTRSENPAAQERAKSALAQLNNGIVDTTPILIGAGLGADGSGEIHLGVTCFDEDEDLRGLRIKERHADPNGGTQVIDELYPVFASYYTSPPYVAPAYSVRIRTADQRKDESAWKDYMISVLDELIRWSVQKERTNIEDAVSKAPPKPTMPPVWISIPEPNQVRVSISAYDRAGHESESIDVEVASYSMRRLREAARKQGR